jgi:hypothetical protein
MQLSCKSGVLLSDASGMQMFLFISGFCVEVLHHAVDTHANILSDNKTPSFKQMTCLKIAILSYSQGT